MVDTADEAVIEARKRVEERRAGFERALAALSGRVERQAHTVSEVTDRATAMVKSSTEIVRHHPKVLVAAAIGVGFAIGSRSAPKRLAAGTVAPAPARTSLLVEAGLFVGRALLKRWALGLLGEPPK
ncbi:MAG: hypothetical protein U1E65_23300 [Myxococcota bacterium]